MNHLSIEVTAENIYDQVRPGFTNLASRARYYAPYCWILHDYFNYGPEREEFASFFRRRERAYAPACLSHDHKDRSVGGGNYGPHQRNQVLEDGKEPLGLSQSHMKSKLGGYGLSSTAPLPMTETAFEMRIRVMEGQMSSWGSRCEGGILYAQGVEYSLFRVACDVE